MFTIQNETINACIGMFSPEVESDFLDELRENDFFTTVVCDDLCDIRNEYVNGKAV